MGLKAIKSNRRRAKYGFPMRLKEKKINFLINKGIKVVLIHETDNYVGRIKERLPISKISKKACDDYDLKEDIA